MRNRFRIVYGVAELTVTPQDEKKLKIQQQPEGDNIFHRKKLGSPVRLKGNGFEFLRSIENSVGRCEEIFFIWETACSEEGEWKIKFEGVFTTNEAKWNLSKCEVEFTPRTNDVYRVLMENYTRDINVLQIQNKVTTIGKLETSDTFEFKEINIGEKDTVVDDGDLWATFLQVTSWVSGTATRRGVRNKLEIIFRLRTTRPLVNNEPVDLSGNGWSLIDTDETTGYYAKLPDLYNFKPYKIGAWSDWNRYPDLRLIPANTPFDHDKYISLNDSGANSGICGQFGLRIRTYLDDTRCYNILWEFGTFTFSRNRKLLDVIRLLIREADTRLEPTTNEELSGFLTSSINPVTLAANRFREPLLTQITDIKRYRSSEAATKGLLNFRDLMLALRSICNVYWFINSRGKIQIEHFSFFGTTTVFDMTVPKWQERLLGTLAYEYEKAKMPRFEKLVFNTAISNEFTEAVIEYPGSCVNKQEGEDTVTITVSKITTDIEGILISDQSFPEDMFVLLSQDGTDQIPKEFGGLGIRRYLNGHYSATNLFETYHKDNRVLLSGFLNNKTVFFNSVVRTKKQVDITLPLCCEEVDPTGKFVTNLGDNGRASSITYSFDGSASFQILHVHSANNPVPFNEAQFDQSFDLSFDA